MHTDANLLLSILQKQLCLRTYYKITIGKGVNTGVNYNQLYTYRVNKVMQVSI